MDVFLSYLGIICGSFIFGFGLNYFIISTGLAEGGFTGVALIIHYLTGLPAGAILAVMNIPPLLLAWYKWGIHFAIKTIISVLVISVSVDILEGIHLTTHDLLFAALYGGVLSGVGIGIVLRSGATTGGLDVIVRLLSGKYGISMGRIYLLFDLGVLTVTALLFGLEKALYTLVTLFVFSQVVDRIIEGINEARAVIIISQSCLAITQAIIKELDRGATIIKGYGAYTGKEREVLYVVVGKRQLLTLKRIVKNLDPHAFVTVSKIHEVLGEGFRRDF